MSSFEALLQAVYRHDLSGLEDAMGTGASVDDTDEDGRTALMHAVLDSGHDVGVIRRLLDLGSAVNHRDGGQKWTALAFAARDQKADVVQLLLDHGAEVDPRDVFGDTPLWRAVSTFQEDAQVIRLLLAGGADPRASNHHGVSPLDLAVTTGKADRIPWSVGLRGEEAT